MSDTPRIKLFDAHFHIIDRRFPLLSNQGYVPEYFSCGDYLERMRAYRLLGGAVVSGSFQALDHSYLVDALRKLGPSFAGVAALPASVTDEDVLALDAAGVRAARFNLVRGGSADINELECMAHRFHALAGWHVELYADSTSLRELTGVLMSLPAVSVDHLGLAGEGFDILLKLAGHGVRVKASGFGRVKLDVQYALRELYAANPDCLMFGTDLPSTRAPRPYQDDDIDIIAAALDERGLRKVLYENALGFYRVDGD